MHLSLGVAVQQRGGHLTSAGVVDAHEQHFGHVLGDLSLGLGEGLQAFSREAIDEQRDVLLETGAAECRHRLFHEALNGLSRKDAAELLTETLQSLRMKCWVVGSRTRTRVTGSTSRSFARRHIDGDRCAIFPCSIDVCQYGLRWTCCHLLRRPGSSPAQTPIAVLDCVPLFSGAVLDEHAASRLAAILRILADPARCAF